MKRFAVTLLAVMFILAGCGKSDSTTPTKDNDNSAQVSYTINNIKIIPGTDFSGAYKELGEPVKYTEAASCYFDGMDKVFTYDGFEVRTYPAESGDGVYEEYFYWGEKLFFAYIWYDETSEYYYYDDGELIRWIDSNGKCHDNETDNDEFVKRGEKYWNNSLKALKGEGTKNNNDNVSD